MVGGRIGCEVTTIYPSKQTGEVACERRGLTRLRRDLLTRALGEERERSPQEDYARQPRVH